MTIDRPQVHQLPWMELFLVHNELVACQQAYTHAYFKETYHELMNFYCPRCGTVWGKRVQPDAPSPRHYYYQEKCKPCGGTENMLLPWEWDQLDVLAPNVMTYLILHTDPGGQNEILENTI